MNKLLIALPIISLLIVGFMISSQKPSLKQDSATYAVWSHCRSNYRDSDPCTNTTEFKLAKQQFQALTQDIDTKRATVSCYLFQQNLGSIEMNNLEINNNRYYEKCFITPQISEILASNSCFNDHYYEPLYMQCAGF